MNSLAKAAIPAMSPEAIDKVRQIEKAAMEYPQCDLPISHTIHSGVYTRTVTIPEGVMITGALIKIPTTLVVHGDVVVFLGEEIIELNGYNVLTASAGRKQAFMAKTETHLTMLFATDSLTVDEAEREFTDEYERLSTRLGASGAIGG
jgi:hypothetical protein